jgi:5-methylcytosine-specific restriction protein A
VCGLIFKDYYGDIGTGFIHVHHLKPVSVMKQEYEMDPISDLRPVCPNCHAMLHKNDPPFSIEELKDLIEKSQK